MNRAIYLPLNSAGEVALRLPDSVVRDRLLQLSPQSSPTEAPSGFVGDSVPLAILAGLQAATTGFTEMIGQIIAWGGDTDSIASMAGQIAGARLGLSRLPSSLLERLPEKDLVERIARDFARTHP